MLSASLNKIFPSKPQPVPKEIIAVFVSTVQTYKNKFGPSVCVWRGGGGVEGGFTGRLMGTGNLLYFNNNGIKLTKVCT